MTRKQKAINEACEAFEALWKYRGVRKNVDIDLYIPSNATIRQIEYIRDNLLKSAKEPLQPATDKQISYLLVLSKDYEDENERIKKAKLNKFQASALIKWYKYTEQLLYSRLPIACCEETYKEIDEEIDYILSSAEA